MAEREFKFTPEEAYQEALRRIEEAAKSEGARYYLPAYSPMY